MLRRTHAIFLAAALATASSVQADLLAYWNFNAGATSGALANTVNTSTNAFPNFFAADGTQAGVAKINVSVASDINAKFFGGTTVNALTGVVAGNDFAIENGNNGVNNGSTLTFSLSLTDFRDPTLTYANRTTSTGAPTHSWGYSLDGINFTPFTTLNRPTTATYTTASLDFSSENSLDGAASVFFRLTLTGGSTTGTAGNNRFDNIQINATTTVIPPPPVLTWNPTGGINTWNTSNTNWLNSAVVSTFANGDRVQFTDAGLALSPNVVVGGTGVAPDRTTVSHTAGTYFFSGGSVGGTELLKTGNGILNLTNQTTNSFPLLRINGGRVVVGNDDQLGATNGEVKFDGGALVITNDVVFDGPGNGSGRTFNVDGGGAVIDTNGYNANIAGDLIGGGTLSKTGLGTLTLATGSENNFVFSGAVNIQQGAIRASGFSLSPGGLPFSGLGSNVTTIGNGAELIIDNIEFGSPTSGTGVQLVLGNNAKLTATGNSTGGSVGVPAIGRSDNLLSIPNNASATPGEVTIRTLSGSDQFVIRSLIRQAVALTGSPTVGNGETDTNTTIIIDGPGKTVLTTGARFTQTTAFAGSWKVNDGMLQIGPVEPGGFAGRLNNTSITENVDDDNNPATDPVPTSFAVSGGDRFGEPLNALGSKLGLAGSSTTFVGYVGNVVTVTNKASAPNQSAILALAVNDKNPLLDARQSEPGQQYGAPALNPGGNFISNVPAYFPNPIVLSGGAVAPAGFVPKTLDTLDFDAGDTIADLGKPTAVPVVGRIGGDLTINAPVNGSGGADSRVLLFDPTGISGSGSRQVQVVGSGDTKWNSRLVIDGGTETGGIFLLARADDILGTPAVTVGANAELVVPSGTTFSYGGKNATYDNTAVAGVALTLNSATVVLDTLTAGVAGFGNVTLNGTNLIEANNNDIVFNYTGESPIGALITAFNSGYLTADGDVGGLPTYLAIAEASDLGATTFSGLTVDDTTVLVKYTYVGDANLDGQVDALDYERIDLAIGNTGVFGTAQGDLNYDGNVDALDYEQVDLNIGNGVGSPLAGVVVPEPASLSLVAVGAGLLGRRRRA